MTADRLLDMALARPAQFSPGSAMKYPNTNYVIAGLLIEAVTASNASAAGMSGELISTNEDTAAFITALLDGRVVPPAQLSQMMDTVEQSDEGESFLDDPRAAVLDAAYCTTA
jgi:D-alanyl-D-alanine carboxypeptidase